MKEPIMQFKSEKEAKQCLKEWQHRLFLDDWIIKIVLCSEDKMLLKNCSGENEFERVSKSAVIRINNFENDSKDNYIVKICDECVLVHELLHCKYNWIKTKPNDIESIYYNDREHQMLEEMAKSFLMAKYNIDFKWFKNFK